MHTKVAWPLDQARTQHMIQRELEANQKLTLGPNVSSVTKMAGDRCRAHSFVLTVIGVTPGQVPRPSGFYFSESCGDAIVLGESSPRFAREGRLTALPHEGAVEGGDE